MKATGHNSLQMVERYDHETITGLKAVEKAVSERIAPLLFL
jgi:hypothetical protein